MTSKNAYIAFVNGLNFGRHPEIMSMSDLVMHVSLTSRAMSPTEAKETIASLLKEGVISKKGDNIDLGNLYDPTSQRYVMRGKSGKTLKSKPGVTGARTVRYVAPGLTRVSYAHRVLDIHFKETPKEFEARARLRKSKAAKKAAKTRAKGVDALYLDRDEYGNTITVTKTGRKADSKARSRTDKAKKVIAKRDIAKDRYSIEDMRAMLKDDHWEEVCGNRKWNYDNAATVREFKKYLKRRI